MTAFHLPDGRVFTLEATRPYVRKDLTTISVEDWFGDCQHPGCAAHFKVTIPAGQPPESSKAFGQKHCRDHKLSRAECLQRANAARKAKK